MGRKLGSIRCCAPVEKNIQLRLEHLHAGWQGQARSWQTISVRSLNPSPKTESNARSISAPGFFSCLPWIVPIPHASQCPPPACLSRVLPGAPRAPVVRPAGLSGIPDRSVPAGSSRNSRTSRNNAKAAGWYSRCTISFSQHFNRAFYPALKPEFDKI